MSFPHTAGAFVGDGEAAASPTGTWRLPSGDGGGGDGGGGEGEGDGGGGEGDGGGGGGGEGLDGGCEGDGGYARPMMLSVVSIEPLKLARSASVKSMVLTPASSSRLFLLNVAVSFEPVRSALVRLVLAKSIVVSPERLLAVSHEPLRSAFARLASVKSIMAS